MMATTIVDCLNNDFVKQFMCATDLTKINFENMSDDVVNMILTMLSYPILEKYPIKTFYLLKLLKTIINQKEINGNIVCDELYLKYVKLIQRGPNEGPFYKHYALKNDICNEPIESIITIQESTSIVSQGTTGLCTWQAGIALSCWCLKNKEKLENKFIVELGCGTGLSGISACINCKPREYWFTDCHAAVLNTLNHNIEINENYRKFNCKYNVVQFSWEKIEDFKMFEEKSPDIVLAADVVFDQTMFESLCNCLKYFIIKNSTEIILFCTLRNPETNKQFLETLEKYNLNFTQDILPDNYSIVLQQDCPIYIINVKQNINICL